MHCYCSRPRNYQSSLSSPPRRPFGSNKQTSNLDSSSRESIRRSSTESRLKESVKMSHLDAKILAKLEDSKRVAAPFPGLNVCAHSMQTGSTFPQSISDPCYQDMETESRHHLHRESKAKRYLARKAVLLNNQFNDTIELKDPSRMILAEENEDYKSMKIKKIKIIHTPGKEGTFNDLFKRISKINKSRNHKTIVFNAWEADDISLLEMDRS